MNWTRENTLALLQSALDASNEPETEATFQASQYGLTRFAGSAIHQNMCEEDAILAVRVAVDSRLGTSATNQFDAQSIVEAVRRAKEMALLNEPNPDFAGFAQASPLQPLRGPACIPVTAAAGPDERAGLVERLTATTGALGFEASGAVSSGVYTTAVATRRGQQAYQQETRAHGLTVVNRPGRAGFGTGYAEWYGRDLTQFDPAAIASRACQISARNEDPQPVEPGAYTVILTPEAVGMLLFYLSWMGLHARALQSRQSFLTGRFGQPVLSEKISITDDGLDSQGFGIPFDWEGRPKQRVDLIERGIARDVVYDSFTASRASRPSTGHALNPLRDRYYSSPLPEHLVMAPGDDTLEDMIASTPRGILINHLWYVREVHYGKTIVTGMTRDGTFLVENGKVTRALRNLRFTQSVAEAFSNVEMVGKDLHLAEQFIGWYRVPALKVANFTISASSSF